MTSPRVPQSVTDALSDAETLRLFRSYAHQQFAARVGSYDAYVCADILYSKARGTLWNGITCILCGFVPRMGNRRTATSRANWIRHCQDRHVQKHARAAFRAVPGLR